MNLVQVFLVILVSTTLGNHSKSFKVVLLTKGSCFYKNTTTTHQKTIPKIKQKTSHQLIILDVTYCKKEQQKNRDGREPRIFLAGFYSVLCWHCSFWQLLAGQSRQWEQFIELWSQMPNGDFVLVWCCETTEFLRCY